MSTLTNLDLKQLDPATCAIQTSSTSTIDNVEEVRSQRAQTGQEVLYDVRASSGVDGLAAEPFALAAARPLTSVASPIPGIALSASSRSVEPGQDVTVTATVTDASADLTADAANVTLNLPAGVELVQGDQTQQRGTLSQAGQAGDSAQATWIVRATADGSYSLSASSNAQHCSEHFASQAGTGFTATTPQPPASGGGGGGTEPGPTPQPTPTPIVKLAPHLRVGAPRWRRGRLRVSGSVARGAPGQVLVTYTAKSHGKMVRVRVRATLRRGRFSRLLRIPRRMRSGGATLTVFYAGDARYKAQRVSDHIR